MRTYDLWKHYSLVTNSLVRHFNNFSIVFMSWRSKLYLPNFFRKMYFASEGKRVVVPSRHFYKSELSMPNYMIIYQSLMIPVFFSRLSR